jgi:hypothetical protein
MAMGRLITPTAIREPIITGSPQKNTALTYPRAAGTIQVTRAPSARWAPFRRESLSG